MEKKHDTSAIKIGQRWKNNNHLTTVRVMAIAEGYILLRRKGGSPFVMWYKDFIIKHSLTTPTP